MTKHILDPINLDDLRCFIPKTAAEALAISVIYEPMSDFNGRFEEVHKSPATDADHLGWQKVADDLGKYLLRRPEQIVYVGVGDQDPDRILKPVRVGVKEWYQPKGYQDELAVSAVYENRIDFNGRYIAWTGKTCSDQDYDLWRDSGRRNAARLLRDNGTTFYEPMIEEPAAR